MAGGQPPTGRAGGYRIMRQGGSLNRDIEAWAKAP